MATAATLMTTEELLAMPDDGVERWLIRGELREKRPPEGGPPMTVRNRYHSRVLMFVGHVLYGAILGRYPRNLRRTPAAQNVAEIVTPPLANPGPASGELEAKD